MRVKFVVVQNGSKVTRAMTVAMHSLNGNPMLALLLQYIHHENWWYFLKNVFN